MLAVNAEVMSCCLSVLVNTSLVILFLTLWHACLFSAAQKVCHCQLCLLYVLHILLLTCPQVEPSKLKLVLPLQVIEENTPDHKHMLLLDVESLTWDGHAM